MCKGKKKIYVYVKREKTKKGRRENERLLRDLR